MGPAISAFIIEWKTALPKSKTHIFSPSTNVVYDNTHTHIVNSFTLSVKPSPYDLTLLVQFILYSALKFVYQLSAKVLASSKMPAKNFKYIDFSKQSILLPGDSERETRGANIYRTDL